MKKTILKLGKTLACFALMFTVFNVNTCCALFAYQPELPEGADDLCKF